MTMLLEAAAVLIYSHVDVDGSEPDLSDAGTGLRFRGAAWFFFVAHAPVTSLCDHANTTSAAASFAELPMVPGR